MKKNFKQLLLLLLFVPFIYGCEEESNGSASIVFDQESTYNISEDGKVLITGTVKSDPGTIIENISVMCLYKAKVENPDTKELIDKNVTELIADMEYDEIKKVNPNEYTFTLTEKNHTISSHITVIYGVRVNARVKNGERSTQTLDVRAKSKL